jgi:hypothetical protein
MMKTSLILSLFLLISISSFSQNESEESKEFKNSIRYNLSTPSILGIENIIFGYERVLGKNRSFTLAVGLNKLPYLAENIAENNDSEIELLRNGTSSGFHFSGDYRFYLKSENKFDAPRGVYIGPYYSFNSHNRGNEWALNTESFDGNVSSELNFRIHSIGGELGYQFKLGKRFLLDFTMFGPGLAFYKAEIGLNTDLSEENELLLLEKINEILSERIPGFNNIVPGEGIEKTGTTNTTSLGYRFLINIAYRF